MILRHTRRSAAHANAIYYIAGPPQMVAGLRSTVSSLGVDEDDIRIEDFAGY
jgi:ferredoxin-NADP reductase